MTTRKREIPIGGEAVNEDAAPAAAEDTVPADDRDALTKERDQLADSLLRLRAEFDNYRRRSAGAHRCA